MRKEKIIYFINSWHFVCGMNFKDIFNKDCRVTCFEKPFPHFLIEKAFDPAILAAVKKALLKEKFSLQNSDLFSFLQYDIDKSRNQTLQEFSSFLHSDTFIKKIIEITRQKGKWTDVSAFIYEKTQYLLTHDDRMATRKVAYVVNLSTLSEEEGGALALYETQGKRPTRITKRIFPVMNTLVLFIVSPESFHEVEEVVGDTQRITITGWLHNQ